MKNGALSNLSSTHPHSSSPTQVNKLAHLWYVGTSSWKIGTLLARWQVIGTLAQKNEKLASIFLRWHVDNAVTHGTYGTRFSKLSYALWKCKCDHENYNWLLWYGDLTLTCDQRKLSRCGLLDRILCKR